MNSSSFIISPGSGPIANYSQQQYIKVKEKEEAWKKYKDAVEEGKTAGSREDVTYILLKFLLLVVVRFTIAKL